MDPDERPGLPLRTLVLIVSATLAASLFGGATYALHGEVAGGVLAAAIAFAVVYLALNKLVAR